MSESEAQKDMQELGNIIDGAFEKVAEYNNLKGQNDLLKEQLGEKDAALAIANAAKKAAEESQQELQGRYELLEGQKGELQSQYDELKGNYDTAQTRLDLLEGDKATLETEKGALEQRVNDIEGEKTALQQELEAAKSNTDAVDAMARERDEAREELQKYKDGVKALIGRYQ